MTENNDNQSLQRLRELYPDLSEEELAEAGENLRQYVAAVYRVHCRLYDSPEARAKLDRLTSKRSNGGMKEERSKSNN